MHVWHALGEKIRSKLVLLFVGQETHPEYASTLRQKACAVPDGDRIVFVGPSDHPEEWLQCADLFISGSLHEGMPLAPLEAAGSGLPTVLSDIEGHAYLKPWARFFDPNTPEDGARVIEGILNDLDGDKEKKYFSEQWSIASALRDQWGTLTMTTSYANVFRGA